ncbi:MAG: TonB-dependent receptor, partial [Algicola sp.]|nr:TonB-dependent receptor [Algicola sp.]
SMTLGARFTKEEKDAVVYNGVTYATIYPQSGWVPGYVRDEEAINADVPKVLDDSDQWSRFTPRVGVEYQHSNDMMWYASYSQGFKSGTFNPRATTAEPSAAPEVVDSFEVGFKSEWNDNLRLNATLFQLDHKDRQFVTVLPGENPGDLDQRLGNIGKSKASGAEIEIQYAATADLNVNFSLGYIDAEFEEALTYNGTGFDDLSDRYSITNTPKNTANIGFDYSFENDLGSFVLNGNYYYRSKYELIVLDNLLTQDGYGLANLSLNWFSNDDHWQAGLHLKNLSNKEYLVGTYGFVTLDEQSGDYLPGLGGDNTLIGYYGEPRTVALTVSYRF